MYGKLNSKAISIKTCHVFKNICNYIVIVNDVIKRMKLQFSSFKIYLH